MSAAQTSLNMKHIHFYSEQKNLLLISSKSSKQSFPNVNTQKGSPHESTTQGFMSNIMRIDLLKTFNSFSQSQSVTLKDAELMF